MKKVILVPPGQYDKGTYKIKGGGKFNGLTIWNTQKTGVVADIKAAGYEVFEKDWKFNGHTGSFQETLKKI